MNQNLELLEDIYDVLETERKEIHTLLNNNLVEIEEIDSYLQDLSNKEDDNFKIFSPRDIESVHKEQIESDALKRKTYEEENINYKKRLTVLETLIDKMQKVIHNLKEENKSGSQENTGYNKQIGKETEIESQSVPDLDNLHIAHQILNCVSYLPLDIMRAKTELTGIAKRMMRQSQDVEKQQ